MEQPASSSTAPTSCWRPRGPISRTFSPRSRRRSRAHAATSASAARSGGLEPGRAGADRLRGDGAGGEPRGGALCRALVGPRRLGVGLARDGRGGRGRRQRPLGAGHRDGLRGEPSARRGAGPAGRRHRPEGHDRGRHARRGPRGAAGARAGGQGGGGGAAGRGRGAGRDLPARPPPLGLVQSLAKGTRFQVKRIVVKPGAALSPAVPPPPLRALDRLLIDLLGMYDLAHEMRQIVDKTLLQKIHGVLSRDQHSFLQFANKQSIKWTPPKLNLVGWDGDAKKLRNLLHYRGLFRLAMSNISAKIEPSNGHLAHRASILEERSSLDEISMQRKCDHDMIHLLSGHKRSISINRLER